MPALVLVTGERDNNVIFFTLFFFNNFFYIFNNSIGIEVHLNMKLFHTQSLDFSDTL